MLYLFSADSPLSSLLADWIDNTWSESSVAEVCWRFRCIGTAAILLLPVLGTPLSGKQSDMQPPIFQLSGSASRYIYVIKILYSVFVLSIVFKHSASNFLLRSVQWTVYQYSHHFQIIYISWEKSRKTHLQVCFIFWQLWSQRLNFPTFIFSCSIIHVAQTSLLSLSYLHMLQNVLPALPSESSFQHVLHLPLISSLTVFSNFCSHSSGGDEECI
jgi:hypothetical protein